MGTQIEKGVFMKLHDAPYEYKLCGHFDNWNWSAPMARDF